MNIDTFDDDDEDKSNSDLDSPISAELKMRKKSSATYKSVSRVDKMNVEGMTPPSASPFQVPMFNDFKMDAYLHPCAKKFSTEEVQFNKENSYRSIARFSTTDRFKMDSSTPSEGETPRSSNVDSDKHIKYRGIGDILAESLYDH